MKNLKIIIAIATAATLTACSIPGWMSLGDADPGEVLMPGEAATLQYFTNIPNFDTEVGLQASGQYELKVNLLSNWVDLDIDKNENDPTSGSVRFCRQPHAETRRFMDETF